MADAASTRRLVINGCYGGFSLSPKGDELVLERRGKCAYFYVEDRESASKPGDRDYVQVGSIDAHDAFMHVTLSEDVGERVAHSVIWPDGKAHPSYFDDCSIDRDDPDLVAVIEEHSSEASGRHAKLHVVEIPADVKWEIEEYDGVEWVAEEHRTWQ